MDLLFLTTLGLVLIFISAKQIKSFAYYANLLLCGLMVQIGLLLPYIYFPFRPFDYRNAKLVNVE